MIIIPSAAVAHTHDINKPHKIVPKPLLKWPIVAKIHTEFKFITYHGLNTVNLDGLRL